METNRRSHVLEARRREPVGLSLRDGLPAASSAPRGFTLTELLVVIGIIAVLAALVTPAVLNARKSASNAALKAELDMLHMAVMNYRNEYGSFPPCVSDLTATGPAGRHIARIYPRCTNVVSQLGATPVSPDTALVAWLQGYTNDPMNPVTGAGGRKKLFDFDSSRVVASRYAPSGKPGSPYIYIDSARYSLLASGTTLPGGTYTPQLRLPATFFNPDTFQILCAGQDQVFGNDDDISNFWKGTRKEYVDSQQ